MGEKFCEVFEMDLAGSG